MQLYSVDQKRSQALEAHAAAFATLKVRLRCGVWSPGSAARRLTWGVFQRTAACVVQACPQKVNITLRITHAASRCGKDCLCPTSACASMHNASLGSL